MNTKLTLSLNKQVIDKAKLFAKEKNVSLSSIVENYLLKLLSDIEDTVNSKASVVDELSGIIKIDADHDYKADWANHMMEKHT